ncbi:MAG: hypothetical protein QP753_01220 [Peptoniphilus harei]|uniref:hypothetical protein n=1 Tax=Peptoniphilus harei TaxID=54005 RepID=UPI00254FBBB1|nr:hypothetical protein [Peptoniphilus harei]MDK7754641.1 hypothetical protein [Peptoniphilus harei]MDK7760447.1 hypothetical protein [Peptoniphilus harei]MDK8270237.1 hypothetical protein [Peptoniphilus harei]MDK8338697.1 hypothetical protein [Peptoniphilus harei]
MSQEKELKEASQALLDLKNEIDKIIKITESASRWGLFDLFADSGLVGLVKRGKIKDINSNLKIVRDKLEVAKRELNDIRIDLDEEIPDSTYDFFVDVIFDNIFTDLRVNREIKEIREKLEDLGDRVDELLRKIN